jgi:hypothetical protein
MLSSVIVLVVGVALALVAARVAELARCARRRPLVVVRAHPDAEREHGPRAGSGPVVSLHGWDAAARAQAMARHPSSFGQRRPA